LACNNQYPNRQICKTAALLYNSNATMTSDEITPKTDLPFNFGLASTRDTFLYTCERPGGDPGAEGGGGSSKLLSRMEAQPQIDFLRQRAVQNVLILLDDKELEHYEEPGLIQLYERAGIQVHRQPMGEEGAAQNILKIIQQMESNQQPIAAHCTHGMGRSGRVAAAWVSARYGLSPEEATMEVMDWARSEGIQRMGNANKLEEWLGGANLTEG
jgi:protein-tyrosine phosphatase